jgi:hypothetical protein
VRQSGSEEEEGSEERVELSIKVPMRHIKNERGREREREREREGDK